MLDEVSSWQTWVTNADIVKELQEVTAATDELRASMSVMRDLMGEQQEQQHMMHRELMTRLDQFTDTGRFQIQTVASSGVAADAGWGGWNVVPVTSSPFPWPPEHFKEWGLAGESNGALSDAGVRGVFLEAAKRDPLLYLAGDKVLCKWCKSKSKSEAQWSDGHLTNPRHEANLAHFASAWEQCGKVQVAH